MDRKAYKDEWLQGEGAQMDNVTKASQEAGFGPITKVLHSAGARICSYLCENSDDKVVILDNGAGPGYSARAVVDALGQKEKSRVKFILLDPAEKKLAEAKSRIGSDVECEVLPPCSDYEVFGKTDLKPGSADILLNVAGGKHHNMLAPWDVYNRLLKKGGYFVDVDWNVDCWRPAIVYDMMNSWNWEGKEETLSRFMETFISKFTGSRERDLDICRKRDYPKEPMDLQAVKDMMSFWTGYGALELRSGGQGTNAIMWPEGHTHAFRLMSFMRGAGLKTDTSGIRKMIGDGLEIEYDVIRSGKELTGKRTLIDFPHDICPDTSLWSINVGQKE
jgi:hypothetical protein